MEFSSLNKLVTNENELVEIQKRHRLLYIDNVLWYSSPGEEEKLLIANINKMFNDSEKRCDGLQLLSVMAQTSSRTVILENYRGWIHHIRKFILHDSSLHVRLLAAKILGKILLHCHTDSEHSRYLASTLVPNIIPQLLDLGDEWELIIVHTVYFILNYLPGPTRPFMSSIQKRLLEVLNSSDPAVIKFSAMCISRIPFSTAISERGASRGSIWLDYFRKFLQTLRSLLNFLFRDLELEVPSHIDLSEQVPLPLTVNHNDETSLFVDTYFRCCGICLCLENLIKASDNASVPVPVEDILEVITRILNINGKNLADNCSANHRDLLYVIIPMLHSSALKLLETLIASCKKQLLFHGPRILNILLRSLSWPVLHFASEKSKSVLSKLRITTYRVLIMWCQTVGPSANISALSDAFLKQMVSDAFIEQNCNEEKEVTTKEIIKTPSKKQKMNQYLNLSSTKNMTVIPDVELCCTTLKALRFLLCNYSNDFKSSGIKDLFTRVSNTLWKLQRCSLELSSDPLFSDYCCRKALYKLLFTMMSVRCLVTRDTVSTFLKIFSKGCEDNRPDISQTCHQARSFCQFLIEPVRLNLPVKATIVQTLVNSELNNAVETNKNELALNCTGEALSTRVVDKGLLNATDKICPKNTAAEDASASKIEEINKNSKDSTNLGSIQTQDASSTKELNPVVDLQSSKSQLANQSISEEVTNPHVSEIILLGSPISTPITSENSNSTKPRDISTKRKLDTEDIELSCKVKAVDAKSRTMIDDSTKNMLNSFVLAGPDE